MQTSREMFLALLICCVISGNALAADNTLTSEVDPSVGPTVEVELQQTAATHGFAAHGVGYLSVKAAVGAQPGLDVLLAQGQLQWTDGTWGFDITPRLKITALGSRQAQGNLFIQQGYGYYRHPYGDVKVGKVYQRFGRFWDYGYYGPLLANYDIKQQPDLGVSFEGAPSIGANLHLEYAAQYFVVDGHSLSVSNPRLFSSTQVRHRNIAIVRAAPTYHVSPTGKVALGISAQRHEVTTATPAHQVLRGAVDAAIDWGRWHGFAEVGRQRGTDSVFASPSGIGSNTYFLTGVMFAYERFNVRYHFNLLRYDTSYVETLHQPGAEYQFSDNFGLIVEGAWWDSQSPQYAAVEGHVERSIYLVANAKF